MPQGVQAFAVLLLLLPGFLSARIVQMLCARPKQTELDKIVEALLFSFFTYLIFAVSSGTELPLSWSGKADQGGTHYFLEVHRFRLALLAGYAALLGLGWAWIINHDTLLRWLRRGRFTQRTSRISVWNDIFHTFGLTSLGRSYKRQVAGGQYVVRRDEIVPHVDLSGWRFARIPQKQSKGFPLVPPKTVISISYLFFGVHNVDQIISYVGWEQGSAKRIPVMLQRFRSVQSAAVLSVRVRG